LGVARDRELAYLFILGLRNEGGVESENVGQGLPEAVDAFRGGGGVVGDVG